jgi:Zn-dependent protease with chaperone function
LILTYFLQAFAVAESKIGRERELNADALAAAATSKRVLASALVKIHAFSPYWSAVKTHMIESLQSGKQFVDISSLFAYIVNTVTNEASLDKLGDSTLTHPTDTHPPLGLRLKSLDEAVGEVSADVRLTDPTIPATIFFSEFQALECGLSDAECALSQ